MVSENNGFYSSHPSLGLFSFRDTRDAAHDPVHWFLSETGLQRQCMKVPVMTDTHYYIFKTLLLLLLFFNTLSLFTSQCIVGNSCWGFNTHTRFCPKDLHNTYNICTMFFFFLHTCRLTYLKNTHEWSTYNQFIHILILNKIITFEANWWTEVDGVVTVWVCFYQCVCQLKNAEFICCILVSWNDLFVV